MRNSTKSRFYYIRSRVYIYNTRRYNSSFVTNLKNRSPNINLQESLLLQKNGSPDINTQESLEKSIEMTNTSPLNLSASAKPPFQKPVEEYLPKN
jgi:hypothetical protein